jgi:DNA primase
VALPPGFLDELRDRVSLAGLVGRRVRLVRRGREYAGLCPFHNEKTPSFYVVEDKGFFHCFGCGAHGDAIGFVMRADNLDFVEAVERLAAEAGLAVPQASHEEREKAQRQKTLLEALAAACLFYENRLWSPAGARARDYLIGRGLDEQTIRRFRLGWAPDDRRALKRALGGDFPEPLLLEAGLLRAPEAGEAYDWFRDRVLFPITDRSGRVIAFGGRILGDGQPKYLNSPETPLFDKGRVLYGWAAARASVARMTEPRVIVTEGYMDVIALDRAGFPGAVAPLGTALGEAQLAELWRLVPEPILCFDGDAAGQQAAVRALRRALPLLRPGQSLNFATLPPGEDPDSLIRGNGPQAFAEILAAARPLSQMLWEVELGAAPADTPERRAGLERRLGEAVGQIADRGVQAEYRRFVRERLFAAGRAWLPSRRMTPAARPAFVRERPDAAAPRAPGRVQRELLLRMLLNFPALLDEVAEEFAALDLPEPEFDRLRRAILDAHVAQPGLDAPTLRQHLVTNGFAAITETLLSRSVDAGFLERCSDPNSARGEWAHVVAMLSGGAQPGLAEASDALLRDVSAESWDRFLAARERALREGLFDDDRG